MSNRECESIMEGENESKVPEWAWDLGQWAWGRDWDREMKSGFRQWGKGEILSEWPWVREWERKDEEWENEKGRELCHLRGNRVFVCLKFLQSSKCWVLYFVFIYFLLEFQPDSKPVSTWFDQYGPIQPELARICKQKKGHATDTYEMASTTILLVCACRVRV